MPTNSTQNLLSTAEVADALGIGVSTVKRWVEEGILPATKTAGGHRKMLAADVLELARQSNLPVRELARLTAGRAVRSKKSAKELSAELYRALLRGESPAVRELVQAAYRSGLLVETLADEVIGPAMHRVGHDWETGAIDIMHEHRASQICAGALYELKETLANRTGQKRPVAVGAAPEGDLTVLPTLLSQMVLLDAGWEAVNLGPNTPLASVRRAVVELRPRLVWLSVSHGVERKSFRADYADLYREVERSGAAIVLGGRALSERVRAAVPYTAYGDSLTHLAAFANSLHPRPRRPKRGRPVER